MKRGRVVVALVIAVLAAGGLAAGLTLSATAAPRAPAARMVVFDCPGQGPQVRPGQYVLTCADANSYYTRLSWTSWAPGQARASGTLELNDCTPYCAAGYFHAYPVLVILSGSQAVTSHPGEYRYTMMTQILTGPRPRYYDYRTHTWATAPATQTRQLPGPRLSRPPVTA